MIKLQFSFLILSSISLLLFSCSDNPNSIGSDLLPNDDLISFNEYDTRLENILQKSGSFEKKIKLGSASKLIIGKNSSIESSILMQFNVYLSDSLKQYVLNNQLIISKAWIDMPVTYTLGEPSLPFAFTVHNINSPWSPIGFDKDSIHSLNYDNNDISSSKNITDTLISFDLQSNTILGWLKAQADTNSNEIYRGFIMRPAQSTQRFVGFNAVSFIEDPKLPTLNISFITPTNYTDTISVTAYTDIHIATGGISFNSDDIILHGSLAAQGSLFFDFAAFPNDVIIKTAELELSVNQNETLDGNPQSDSILVRMYKDYELRTLTSDSTVFTLLKRDGNKFVGDIGWMVQKWLSDVSSQNNGVNLYLYDEMESVARIALYGSSVSNDSLKPKLKIIYLQKNK